MARFNRLLIISLAAVAIVSVLGSGALFYGLRTSLFRAELRHRVISALQQATGARVDVGSVDLHLRDFSIELGNLVLHGTEAAPSPPLFRAPLVRVRLKLSNLFDLKPDVVSVVVRRPQAFVQVRSDGSTNLPALPGDTQAAYEELLNVRIKRFELDHGVLQVNDSRMPFDARGEDLDLSLTRASVPAQVSFASKNLSFRYANSSAVALDLRVHAELLKDGIQISDLLLSTARSTVQASGKVSHLSQPDASFHLHAQVAAADLARFEHISDLRDGEATFDGALGYQASSGPWLNGVISGQHFAYGIGSVELRNVSLHSGVQFAAGTVTLNDLAITSPALKLNGSAVLARNHRFSLNARVSGLDVQQTLLAMTGRALPWSGTAAGQLTLNATPGGRVADIAGAISLQIAASTTGIPISGDVEASFNGPDKITFSDSRIQLPATQITLSGTPNAQLRLVVNSGSLDDLTPIFQLAGFKSGAAALAGFGRSANGTFEGALTGSLTNPEIDGHLVLRRFQFAGDIWDQVQAQLTLNAGGLKCPSIGLDSGMLHARGSGQLAMYDWSIRPDSALQLSGQFASLNLTAPASQRLLRSIRVTGGTASGSLKLSGSVNDPAGTMDLTLNRLVASGQRVDSAQVEAVLANDTVRVTHGRLQSGAATLAFSGSYKHLPHSWDRGQISARLDGSGFPLRNLTPVSNLEPALDAQLEAHLDVAASISSQHFEPVRADGTATLRGISVNGSSLGNLSINARTRDQVLSAALTGDLRGAPLHGTLDIQLADSLPLKAGLQFGRLDLPAVLALVHVNDSARFPLAGFFDGSLSVEGPLEDPQHWRSLLQIDTLQVKPGLPANPAAGFRPPEVLLQNAGPIVLQAENGAATIRSFQLKGKDTNLTASGTFGLSGRPLNLQLNGSVDLQAFELFDPEVNSSGESFMTASISGSLDNPAVTGSLQLKNGSFFLQNVPNGLTTVNGTVLFNRDRATIQALTAETGGGALRLGGFISFGAPGPLIYHLDAHAENVRLRYAGSASVTANADLRLSGSSNSSLLSGTATVSRVVLSPNTDLGNVLAGFAAPAATPANQKDFVNGLHFDIGIDSASNLQLSSALSRDVEAGVSLHLRGTLDHPVLLGNITANQGDIKLFGTTYSINRGEINFLNTVKIEPVLDLDLQTQTRGITVDITVAGSLNKLNITYRSDPPLQPRDIIALLAVGRAPDTAGNVQSAQANSEASAFQSGAYTVLGQAISPVSNRLSKLFGITNIKIDPLVQGITNAPQARLTLEEQVSRDITVTYVTNLSQTSEQIFRVEWALSRQYSVVALRDDNGEFGIDIQYKKRFK